MPLDYLYEKLKLDGKKELHKKGESTFEFPSRIRNVIDRINYDAIYSINGKPIIIFKEFESRENNEKDIENLHKDIWNLGETPILFIKLNNEYILYNTYIFNKEKNEVWKEISFDDDIFLEEFSYLNLKSGRFWKKYEEEFRDDKKVDIYLLRNLNYAKKILNEKCLEFETINNLIGKLILSRYLIDRDILKRKNFIKCYKKDFEDVIKNKKDLFNYFQYMKKRFNGDAFEITDQKAEKITSEHLKILSDMFKGNDLEVGQTVFFNVYDFSIIPIELLSAIYELFLSKNLRDEEGIYYTSLSLVDYILKYTLDEKLDKTGNCKVLDPSCGSGIFLVESLRKIIEKHDKPLSCDELINIVRKNIFGIDKDANAINISIFSVYLTLLDYVDNINDFTFPELKNKNFFVSDFFNEKSKINNLQKFDVIIGNPPWTVAKGSKKRYEEYCEEKNIKIHNRQISEAFLIRAKDFIKQNGNIALIVTSKILYNINDKNFRKYILENFELKKIFDFSLARNQFFKDANWPGMIIFYKFSSSTEYSINNYFEHISLKPNLFFKLFKKIVVDKYDSKTIKQSELIENDWLWKVLLVGNSLDFNFLKRLKNDYTTLEKFIKHNKSLDKGVGFKKPSSKYKEEKTKKMPKFKGLPYLNLAKKDLKRFAVKTSDTWEFDEIKSGNEKLMEPPHLLIGQSTTSNFDFISAFSENKIVFNFNVQCIQGSENDKKLLKNLVACINSDLFKYFFLMTGNTGIEKNRTSATEKLKFPFSPKLEFDDDLYELVNYIEIDAKNDSDYSELELKINNLINNIYNLSNSEKSLVNYSSDMLIPLLKGKEGPLNPPSQSILKNYANIFLEHFKNSFTPKNFSIDVYDSEYFIGMNFKITDEKSNLITFKDKQDTNEAIELFGFNTIEKIGEIYVKRDIKIFEKDSFAIIKSKENKNWHEAIAWLDLGEFISIMFNGYNAQGD